MAGSLDVFKIDYLCSPSGFEPKHTSVFVYISHNTLFNLYINLSEPLVVCPSVPVCVRSGGLDRSATRRFASLTYFGEVLLCPNKRIVTMTKVYIASNNIHVEIIRSRKSYPL